MSILGGFIHLFLVNLSHMNLFEFWFFFLCVWIANTFLPHRISWTRHMWFIDEMDKILSYEALTEHLKFVFRQCSSSPFLLEAIYSLFLFPSWWSVLLRRASWRMMAISINFKSEKRCTWKMPMLCQHALADFCDLASLSGSVNYN